MYSGKPTTTLKLKEWTAVPLIPRGGKLPTLKRGSSDLASVRFAWQLFWNMGGYDKNPDGDENPASQESTTTATIFKTSTLYNTEDWLEARADVFGPNLEARVKWFQKEMDIPVSGVIDPRTWKKLGEVNGVDIEGSGKISLFSRLGLDKSFKIAGYNAQVWQLVLGSVGVFAAFKILTRGK